MVTVTGIVSEVTFRNEDNGFSVLRFRPEGDDSTVICVGPMPTLEPGESAIVRGQWNQHPRYGRQLTVESYEISRPATKEAILAFLSSGLITNIGGARAQRIVDHFGLGTLDVLDKAPARLLEIEGIGKKTYSKIIDAWERQRSIRRLMMFLQDFGVSVGMAAKIYKTYGSKAQEVISRNPYELISDIWGVGFKRADTIAQRLGFERDSFRRLRAGIIFTLQEAQSDGHLFLPRQELVEKASQILEVDLEKVTFSLDHLVDSRDLRKDSDDIYLPLSYATEVSAAKLLASRLGKPPETRDAFSKEYVQGWLKNYERRTGWRGDPRQVEAVCTSLRTNTFLLTGGPGTGKTSTLQVIVSFFREHHLTVALAAPTGRAAQRMGSIAGLKALTIHRLLEYKLGKDGFFFIRNSQNPIEAGVVIVDEVSMMDAFLIRSLLAAISSDTRLVLVGDNHQLPSVGPGNVLSDLISSQRIPHVHLKTIFRQAAQSTIVLAAHEIIGGSTPHLANAKSDSCFFLSEKDPDHCLQTVVEMVTKRLPAAYGLDSVNDIQVLSPMHKGVLGTRSINRALQCVLNKSDRKLTRGENVFAVGDKVMQIRNNYDLEVYNGDIGRISAIGEHSNLVVNYDGTEVSYEAKNLDELVHAYCISIHKSQGSEFKAVIIPLVNQHFVMLQRTLVYTALTRARELCIFIGMPSALSMAVRNNNALSRYSHLDRRIMELIDDTVTTAGRHAGQ